MHGAVTSEEPTCKSQPLAPLPQDNSNARAGQTFRPSLHRLERASGLPSAAHTQVCFSVWTGVRMSLPRAGGRLGFHTQML